jgi:hypothetical protein
MDWFNRTRARPAAPPRLRRALVSALVLAALLLAGPAPAFAGDGWCSADPVVKIDGKVVDIVISSLDEADELAMGPVQLVIRVPVGISAEILATDRGFGGHGYAISFAEVPYLVASADRLPIEVAVYAPMADGTLPVRLDIRPRSSPLIPASGEGTANAWLTVTTS